MEEIYIVKFKDEALTHTIGIFDNEKEAMFLVDEYINFGKKLLSLLSTDDKNYGLLEFDISFLVDESYYSIQKFKKEKIIYPNELADFILKIKIN